MQEKLIIYLHAHDLEHPSWAIVAADGLVRQSESHDNALGLSQIAEDKEVIVLVPAQEVLLTAVTLPKMSRARLTQALPFALEEKLIDDVETLHFVQGDYHADTLLPVAVVARARMDQWVELLKSWQLQVDVLMPTTFALPLEEDTWHVMLSDMAITRTGPFQGFVCDHANLSELLQLALSEADGAPTHIYIHNYTEANCTPLLDELVKVKEEKLPAGNFINDLAHYAGTLPALNLLQGYYATKKSKFPRRDKLLKATFGFAIVWIALLFLYPTVSYFILKQRTTSIDAQIAEIYKRHFPQSKSVVAPNTRLQEKLQKLSSQVGENHLFLLLGYIGKGMQSTESIKIRHFDYQNNQLTLELTAATSEDFSTFTNFLTSHGLTVKQQNANLTGSRVNATLLIE